MAENTNTEIDERARLLLKIGNQASTILLYYLAQHFQLENAMYLILKNSDELDQPLDETSNLSTNMDFVIRLY
jgi:hypothetical protein